MFALIWKAFKQGESLGFADRWLLLKCKPVSPAVRQRLWRM